MSLEALNRSALLAGVVRDAACGLARGELEQFVEKAVRHYLAQLADEVLATGRSVTLPGFGTFSRSTWSPRVGRFQGQQRHRLTFKAATKRRGISP